MQPGAQSITPQSLIAGRYRPEGVLGQGGFGIVYAARDVTMGRAVALKVLRHDLFDKPDALPRFRREAELAQRLEHPHTVRLYDVGASNEGLAYIAFELLHGRPLSGVIEAEGRLAPERVARIAQAVLSSLMEAHARGIIHRDIKPSNIFLCQFPGAADFVKVLDFGIAKVASDAAQSRSGITATGEVLGTPRYMAPEQALSQPITPAVDLYALGLLMSEALGGEPVYTGHALTVCMEQASPAPVPHRAEVMASPLGPVIQRATEKQVAARYASAEEMRRHIEAVLAQAGAAMSRPLAPLSHPAAAPPRSGPVTSPSQASMQMAPQASMQMAPQASMQMAPQAWMQMAPQAWMQMAPQASMQMAPPGAPQTTSTALQALPAAMQPPMAAQSVAPAPAARILWPIVALISVIVITAGAVLVVAIIVGDKRPKTLGPAASSSVIATAPASPITAATASAGPQPSAAATSTASASASAGTKPSASASGADLPPFNINSATAAMDAVAPGAKGCAGGEQLDLASVQVMFQPTGQATMVTVGGPHMSSSVETCITGVFKTARVAPFSGAPRFVTKTYTF